MARMRNMHTNKVNLLPGRNLQQRDDVGLRRLPNRMGNPETAKVKVVSGEKENASLEKQRRPLMLMRKIAREEV